MRNTYIAATVAFLLFGCAAETTDEVSNKQQGEMAVGRSVAPTPVASIDLPNGHVLEFYDFEVGAIVSESGEANAPPVLNSKTPTAEPLTLSGIWSEVGQGKPMPKALEALEAKIQAVSEEEMIAALGDSTQAPTVGGEKLSSSGAQTLSQTGCGNGCCDFDWLVDTFPICDGGTWMLFNYTYSHANYSWLGFANSMVCAATGTSTFKWDIGGTANVWSVPQGHYRTAIWVAPNCPFGLCNSNLTSSVNTSSSPHLHTYCGAVD